MVIRVSLLAFLALIVGANECACDDREVRDDVWSVLEMFLRWRHAQEEDNETKKTEEVLDQRGNFEDSEDPPPVDQPALMGRYVVNQADWTSVATISSRKDIFSFPIANLISVSDGPLGNGTGIPYMYLTPLDYTAQDLALDDRATLLMSLAQGSYCEGKGMDPMDPRCARIILAGRIEEVTKSSPDYEVAKSTVFERHPWLAHMPPDHRFFFAKLNIASIAVLDAFGGPKYVSVEDYMHPPKIHRPGHRNRHGSRGTDWRGEHSTLDENETRAVYRV